MVEAIASTPRSLMLERLWAEGPHPDHADKLMLFGRLVGSWDIKARFFDRDGNVTIERDAEWHFDWILEGRGVQDVLISPRVEQRGTTGKSAGEYGTTVRLYDPKVDAWHVTWNAPIYGANVQLIAREVDGDIVLEGRGPRGDRYKWVFADITDSTFLWRGYKSDDEGRTWVFDEEMRAVRRRDE
jgi:hypothetical protein